MHLPVEMYSGCCDGRRHRNASPWSDCQMSIANDHSTIRVGRNCRPKGPKGLFPTATASLSWSLIRQTRPFQPFWRTHSASISAPRLVGGEHQIRTDGSCLMLHRATSLPTALVTTRQPDTRLRKAACLRAFLRDAVTWSCRQHHDRR